MPVDPLLKLRDKAVKDPEKATELLDKATSDYVSPEAKTALEKKPHFNEGFIEAEAKRHKRSVTEVQEIADAVERMGEPALVLERRQFAAPDDIRAEFIAHYNREIQRQRTCRRSVRDTDTTNKSGWKECGVELHTIQEALTHHSLHLMYEADNRTQLMAVKYIRELLWPVEEKSYRAALGPEERRRLLTEDPRLRDRLAR